MATQVIIVHIRDGFVLSVLR